MMWHGRVVTANVTPGLGVNANNGSASAEFFLGASMGIGSVFFCVGSHIGHELRPSNNFNVLDRPPADLKSVPVDTPWQPGLAFAMSYRLPLK
jgi:hypothetical protein